jgi:hypothetical protein
MENSFNNGPQNKVAEYIQRYNSGESLESFGNRPESWKKEILASSSKESEISSMNEAKGIEEIQNVLEELGKDNYIFTHITMPNTAEKIYNSNFTYSLGTGLNGTMAMTGSSGAVMQIDKIFAGESPHRGLTGMFIIAIPKDILPTHSIDNKISSDGIENYLIDNYPEMANGIIPSQFNFGYLAGDTLHYKK